MKKLFLFLPLLAFIVLFSCSKEPVEDQINLESVKTSEDLQSISAKSATCDNPIVGPTFIERGSTVSFTVVPRIPTTNPRSIVWSTTNSTNLSIISGQGTRRVTVRVGTNFTAEDIRVKINGGVCQTIKRLKLDPVSCPTSLQIDYAAGNNFCDDFGITLSGSNDVKSVRWYYSIKYINNRYFGTTSNPHQSYAMFKELFLPDSNYSNQILWVTAQVTLKDGTKCTVKGNTIVNCFGSGGSNTRNR